jgi:hypothetical protein
MQLEILLDKIGVMKCLLKFEQSMIEGMSRLTSSSMHHYHLAVRILHFLTVFIYLLGRRLRNGVLIEKQNN